MAAIDPSGDIGAVLNEHGLDKTFWVEKFRKVGIVNDRQLQYADKKVFNDLCQQKRYTWEENALKACLKLPRGEKKNKQEQIEKIDRSLMEILQNLDRVTEEKDRMSKMMFNVQIPPGERDLHKELTKLESLTTELAVREKPTSSEMVSKISSGRILRGYYIHRDVWQRVVPRKHLINIPVDVEILGPRMEEKFTSEEFFNEEKAGYLFTKSRTFTTVPYTYVNRTSTCTAVFTKLVVSPSRRRTSCLDRMFMPAWLPSIAHAQCYCGKSESSRRQQQLTMETRKKNWTAEETATLVSLFEEHKDVLKGKFSPSLTNADKISTWDFIVASQNIRRHSAIKRKFLEAFQELVQIKKQKSEMHTKTYFEL